MGGGGGSKSRETSLSKQQAKILKVHEAQYQAILYPELKESIQRNFGISGPEMDPWMVAQQQKIARSFDQTRGRVAQSFAQRGGGQAGELSMVQGRLKQSGAAQRSSLVQQALGQMQEEKMGAMSLLSRHSPVPSQGAPQLSETKGPNQAGEIAKSVATAAMVAMMSDARLKENIEPIGDALGKVMQLRGVNFDWSGENAANHPQPEEGRQLGFLAQEVEKVIPEVVHTFGDGYKAVSYGQINALLIEAVKDQQKLLKAQAERLEVLESEVYR